MFTGIVEETGRVLSVSRRTASASVRIAADVVLEGTKMGDSIAVNGVCLTVTTFSGGWFEADIMTETLARSSLGALKPGSAVNLERALALSSRLGGHIVSGHVDGTAVVASVRSQGIARLYDFRCDPGLLRFMVEKGSVALDGISLTLTGISETGFSVSVIPHTKARTALGERKPGDVVNVECDVLSKYAEKLLKNRKQDAQGQSGGITEVFLLENGFMGG